MHLLVLSAFRRKKPPSKTKDEEATHVLLYGLNAPSGAQCFPTRGRLWNEAMTVLGMSQCTFWCSVLSDCVGGWACSSGEAGSQCTFWCSVLSDLGQYGPFVRSVVESQCTFWCSVLSDRSVEQGEDGGGAVSMHLLVLSAFRQKGRKPEGKGTQSLNAPSGAQCFPTESPAISAGILTCLNAPSGAQCFPTRR